jgi:CRISPR-associated protein Csx10
MKAITYRITLREPTLVAGLEGDPNEGKALNYLPGSVLRGAIFWKYLRANNLSPNRVNAADPVVQRLFFNGETRFLNGYRLDRLNQRTLPTPQSWHCEKGNETEIFDFAVAMAPGSNGQWQGIQIPFCALSEQHDEKRKVRLVAPERHLAVHTARTRRFGRAMPADKIDPTKGDVRGAVYRYDALAAGQQFEAVILCQDGDFSNIKSLLSSEATLGGSRSGGYGRAIFEFDNEKPAEAWLETSNASAPDVDGKLIITLLSDALLRNATGQFVVDPGVVTQMLSKKLDTTLQPRQAFLRGGLIGGFNRKWGLPLPQTLVIQMGSVFVFDKPACAESKLRDLEAQGIGERRAEGFGRVAVNWPNDAELEVDTTPASPTATTTTVEPGSESEALLRRMAEQLLRQRLNERLTAKANSFTFGDLPRNSQLSRLRNIIRNELIKERPDLQRIRDYAKHIKERDSVKRQFERARISNEKMLDWLNDTLKKTEDSDWEALLGFQAEDVRRVGGLSASITDSLRIEYLLRLIDAVLTSAAKKQRGEGR